MINYEEFRAIFDENDEENTPPRHGFDDTYKSQSTKNFDKDLEAISALLSIK